MVDVGPLVYSSLRVAQVVNSLNSVSTWMAEVSFGVYSYADIAELRNLVKLSRILDNVGVRYRLRYSAWTGRSKVILMEARNVEVVEPDRV